MIKPKILVKKHYKKLLLVTPLHPHDTKIIRFAEHMAVVKTQVRLIFRKGTINIHILSLKVHVFHYVHCQQTRQFHKQKDLQHTFDSLLFTQIQFKSDNVLSKSPN